MKKRKSDFVANALGLVKVSIRCDPHQNELATRTLAKILCIDEDTIESCRGYVYTEIGFDTRADAESAMDDARRSMESYLRGIAREDSCLKLVAEYPKFPDDQKYLKTVYHVTTESAYLKIKSAGLIPKTGKRSKKAKESEEAIYTFRTLIDAQDALANWLGDEFDEDTKLALLEIDVSHLRIPVQKDSSGNEFFEQAMKVRIGAEHIRLLSWE